MGDGAQLEAEVLIWSGVHGLASLLLDGPLVGEFSSTEDRIDFARGVVSLAEVPVFDGVHEGGGIAKGRQ